MQSDAYCRMLICYIKTSLISYYIYHRAFIMSSMSPKANKHTWTQADHTLKKTRFVAKHLCSCCTLEKKILLLGDKQSLLELDVDNNARIIINCICTPTYWHTRSLFNNCPWPPLLIFYISFSSSPSDPPHNPLFPLSFRFWNSSTFYSLLKWYLSKLLGQCKLLKIIWVSGIDEY